MMSLNKKLQRRRFCHVVRRFHRSYMATSERRWIAMLQQRCNDVIVSTGNIQCGFRKYSHAPNCLITMIEQWPRSVDGGGPAGALLTDLSKAMGCIDH